MNNLLFIQSSARGNQSYSHQIARNVVDDLKSADPGLRVKVRNVAQDSLPHIGEAFVSGIGTPPEKRGPAQAAAIALSDTLVDELIAANILVLAVPMYNFGLPSTLKAWIDHVARAGRTFAYTESGPRGLLQGKRAIVVLASGGVYSEGPAKAFDFQEGYLRSVLGFIGISDVDVIRVEGVALGDAATRAALDAARARAREVVRLAA